MSRFLQSTTQGMRRVGAMLLLVALLAVGAAAAAPAADGPAGRAAGSFQSGFNVHHNGWTVLTGSWEHAGSAVFRTDGVAEARASIVRTGAYEDFSYEIRVKRLGCATCANTLVVRSRPAANTENDFAPALFFSYTNEAPGEDGMFSVFRIKPGGAWIVVKGWTHSTAIAKGGWNVLKVEAEGNSFRFYINGTKVWQGTVAGPSAGRVGISMYTDASSTGNDFRVDWARLTVKPTDLAGFDPPVQAGVEVPGGSVDRSPGS